MIIQSPESIGARPSRQSSRIPSSTPVQPYVASAEIRRSLRRCTRTSPVTSLLTPVRAGVAVTTCLCGAHSLATSTAPFAFRAINVGPYSIGPNLPPIQYKGEQYRLDSRLLIIEGCLENNVTARRGITPGTVTSFG